MKKSLFFAALASVALASCSSEDVIMQIENGSQQSENVAIGFRPYTGGTTRAQVLNGDATNADNKTIGLKTVGFGVTAILNAKNGDATTSTEFMSNEKVTYGTSAWTYTDIKYWPKDEANNTLDFYFYAPQSTATETSSTVNVTKPTVTGLTGTRAITLDFVVNNTVANQTDLLWAAPVTSAKKSTTTSEPGTTSYSNNGTVTAKFKHLLSRVGFVAKNTTDKVNIKINNVKLIGQFNTGGKLNLIDGTFPAANLAGGSSDVTYDLAMVAGEAVTVPYKAEVGAGSTYPYTEVSTAVASRYMMLMPTSAAIAYSIYIDYDVITYSELDASGVGASTNQKSTTNNKITISKSGDDALQFVAGKAYTFVLNIGLDEIKFSADVADWDTTPGNTNIDVQ